MFVLVVAARDDDVHTSEWTHKKQQAVGRIECESDLVVNVLKNHKFSRSLRRTGTLASGRFTNTPVSPYSR